MQNRTRAALSLGLSMGLVFSMNPAAVFADEATTADSESSTTQEATPATYTLTFSLAKGKLATGKKKRTVQAGAKVKLPNATRTGYVFKGWSDGSKTYQAKKKYTMPDSDTTLTAKWEKEKVTYKVKVTQVGKKGSKSVSGSKSVGTTSGYTELNGMAVKVTKSGTNVAGSIKYKVYRDGKGWTQYKTDGKLAGSSSSSRTVTRVKVALTGKIKKKFDVYYRVNVRDYGWMAWASNGEQTGTKSLNRPVRAVQVKLVAASDKDTKKSIKKSNKGKVAYASKKYKVEEFMGTVLTKRGQSQSSSTKYLIMIDTHINHFAILKGKKGNWELFKSWKCSTGKPGHRTCLGKYTLGDKGYSFGHGYTCYYYSRIYDGWLIHSIKYHEGTHSVKDGRLGVNVSMGCVRLAIKNAKYVWDNIPSGTGIYIY